jgi:hypothetical protein
MPANERLLELIEQEFFAGLMEKTGWGRNDVKSLYHAAVAKACVRLIDEKVAAATGFAEEA